MDTADADTKSALATLLSHDKEEEDLYSAAVPSREKMLAEAQAQAMAVLLSQQEEMHEATMRKKEERRREMQEKHTPEDNLRVEATKLANLVQGKLKKLQAALVSIEDQPTANQNDIHFKQMCKAQHDAQASSLTEIKQSLDAAIAMKSKATLEFLMSTVDSNQKRSTCAQRLRSSRGRHNGSFRNGPAGKGARPKGRRSECQPPRLAEAFEHTR